MSEASSSDFWRQPAAERTLRQSARLRRIPSALLLTGPDGVGKWSAALWVAKSLLCRECREGTPCGSCRDCARVQSLSHPDLHVLLPVPGKTAEESHAEFINSKISDPFAVIRFEKRPYITLERIRALVTELHLTAIEGGAKVVIIHDAEQTKDDNCQSVLLKTIEEPPPDAHFILTSAAPERLLPTIVSRCQTVRLVPADLDQIVGRLVEEKGLDHDEAVVIARLSGGGWGNAVRLSGDAPRAWRNLVTEFWNGAFRVKPHLLMAQIEATFRPGNKRAGFDQLLQAFDIWSLCLWQECREISRSNPDHTGAPFPDLETAWSCWRILLKGRATLYVNVPERLAIAGTFLAIRRRLNCLS